MSAEGHELSERICWLRAQAARARHFAFSLADDPAAPRLSALADEYEAEIIALEADHQRGSLRALAAAQPLGNPVKDSPGPG